MSRVLRTFIIDIKLTLRVTRTTIYLKHVLDASIFCNIFTRNHGWPKISRYVSQLPNVAIDYAVVFFARQHVVLSAY